MSDQSTNQSQRRGRRNTAIARREASISKKSVSEGNSTQIAFTLYVIAIAAKLANIGTSPKNVSHQIDSFKEIFAIPESEASKIDGFYKDAAYDKIPAAHYAKQLTNLFPNNRLLLEELIDDLFVFADADGVFTNDKILFLKEVVLSLQFNENFFARVLRKHLLNYDPDPFKLLNVSQKTSYVDLKKAYRKAISDCHPDKFANNAILELRHIAEEQFKHYTSAYESIKTSLGYNKKFNRQS